MNAAVVLEWYALYCLSPIILEVRVLEQKRDAVVIDSEESAMSYYRLRQQIAKLAKEMHRFIVRPKYLLPFLQPGRLIQASF